MGDNDEVAVRAAVAAFYAAFDDGFKGPATYATEDWNHINPFGGRDVGREDTLTTVRAVHETFLKGVTDTIQSMDVRFASNDVAIATVLSRMSTVTLPDGGVLPEGGQIRTFVVVRRGEEWLITHDHNTNLPRR